MTTTATNRHVIATPSRRVIDGIFVRAIRVGMAACDRKGSSAPPPKTGSNFWTESQAEDNVISKVRIPYCNIDSADPECTVKAAQGLQIAECRGLDEKPGTFTYSRFTCDVVLRGGRTTRKARRLANRTNDPALGDHLVRSTVDWMRATTLALAIAVAMTLGVAASADAATAGSRFVVSVRYTPDYIRFFGFVLHSAT